MAAPPTTSLDKIRSQIAMMRTQNMKQVADEKAARERKQWLTAQEKQQARESLLAGVKLGASSTESEGLTDFIKREYARMNKPNDVFRSGKEVVDGVAQRAFLLQQKRFQDADEVLRKTGKEEDTNRFVKLAFAPSSEQTAKLVVLLQHMRAQWTLEKENLESTHNISAGSSDTNTVSKLAWMQVLEQLSDQEVRLLWEANVLDADTLASLFAEAPNEETDSVGNASEEVADDSGDAPAVGSLLNEKIDLVQRLHYLQELTTSICETELGNVPSIDLAPTLLKVQRRQFADVSEEELRKLEQYGEAPAMQLSVAEQKLQAPAEVNSKRSGTPQNKPPIQIGVPAAILDRALTPSNSFLSAISEKDAALKKSLEGLERIKREALLDPEFQEAVRFAHAVEEASVAPHLHGQPLGSDGAMRGEESAAEDDATGSGSISRGAAQRVVSKRERRAARSRQLRGPIARSPYSPEVVPYFYNDMRSIVPPRGAFNLPKPTPTKAERAEMRGRRRRAYQRSRYRK